ncbi:MAG: HAMP domain-containing histidine kinase [Bacteroidales bacterium]|nr:HAMP domain-containing histidine kinase [Bacteroidales bacterium]
MKERTSELKALNATKDKFFSIIAHDLKNPFNTLLGFSELLLENITEYSDEKKKEFLGYLHNSAKSGFALLQNLLEWSRSQTGRIKIVKDNINLNILVEEAFGILKSTAERKYITLENKIGQQVNVYADENMVQTVVRNLVSNAIKFTPTGGRVTITTAKKATCCMLPLPIQAWALQKKT